MQIMYSSYSFLPVNHTDLDFQLQESLPQPQYPHMFLTGNLEPAYPVITAEAKEQLLEYIAGANRVLLSEVLCVGDGANDLKMLELVGLGGGFAVAFKAKEHVQKLVSLFNTITNSAEAKLYGLRRILT